jgi:hypothetical protein
METSEEHRGILLLFIYSILSLITVSCVLVYFCDVLFLVTFSQESFVWRTKRHSSWLTGEWSLKSITASAKERNALCISFFNTFIYFYFLIYCSTGVGRRLSSYFVPAYISPKLIIKFHPKFILRWERKKKIAPHKNIFVPLPWGGTVNGSCYARPFLCRISFWESVAHKCAR